MASPVIESLATSADIAHLRRAFNVAAAARARGDHPFGAILVNDKGDIVLEAMNTCRTANDATGHAERNLMTHASKIFTAEDLARSTMVTSAEPCVMCAGAAYWVGIGRIVYGLSEKRLKDMIGPHPENLTLDLECRSIFAAGQRPIAIAGPLLEDEAAVAHQGFWTGT
jgi:tRNA(Arg) A34 adenosine deaminase TadA